MNTMASSTAEVVAPATCVSAMIARFCSADHDRRVLAMTMCAGLATGPDMVPIQKPASASYPAPSHKHKAPVTDFQLPTNPEKENRTSRLMQTDIDGGFNGD